MTDSNNRNNNILELTTESFIHYNALHLSPYQIYQFENRNRITQPDVTVVNEDFDQDDDDNDDEVNVSPKNHLSSFTFDSFLNDLSRICFIISSSVSRNDVIVPTTLSKTNSSQSYVYFTMRFPNNLDKNSNIKKRKNDLNDDSLWSKFASLSLSNNSSDGTNEVKTTEDEEHVKEKIYETSLKTASKFIVCQMVNNNDSSIDDEMVMSAVSASNTNSQNDKRGSSNGTSSGGILFQLSKKVFNKASSAFTSVLASYDLAHEQILPSEEDGEEVDDYVQHARHDYINYEHDADNIDDAFVMSFGTKSDKYHSRLQIDSLVVTETDTIWNIKLMIDCTLLIIHHAKQKILSSMNDEDLDLYDQYISISTTNQQQQTQRRGVLLNRWGDDKLSFLSFCLDTANATITTSSNKERHESMNLSHSTEKIGNILSHITHGTTLELILMILIETNNAILSSDGNIVALLFPSSSSFSYIPEYYHIDKVHDVDIAIFKLNSTISSLEKRIESLTNQADKMKQCALQSKRQQQKQLHSNNNKNDNHNKVALMYMKRRQIYLNEIEKCSSSLLNVESGLHSLKRARNDAQLIKVYEMMNETMKLMKDETMPLSHVEEVMEDFRQNNEELEEIQDCISGTSSSALSHQMEMYDIDDLEKELLALEQDGGNDGNNGDCSIGHDTQNKNVTMSSDSGGQRKQEGASKLAIAR